MYSKKKANYKLTTGKRTCGNCKYRTGNKCFKVSGTISKEYTCKYWG